MKLEKNDANPQPDKFLIWTSRASLTVRNRKGTEIGLIWTKNLWMFQLSRTVEKANNFSDGDFLKGIDDCEDTRQARAYMFC